MLINEDDVECPIKLRERKPKPEYLLIRTLSTFEETRDRISSDEPPEYSAWMDDRDPLLIRKQEPWYMRTPQSLMEIRLISMWNENATINYGKVD